METSSARRCPCTRSRPKLVGQPQDGDVISEALSMHAHPRAPTLNWSASRRMEISKDGLSSPCT
eukprot:366165-Chlamydomonas_euryale.AAC.2